MNTFQLSGHHLMIHFRMINRVRIYFVISFSTPYTTTKYENIHNEKQKLCCK